MNKKRVPPAKVCPPRQRKVHLRSRLFARLDQARRSPCVWVAGPPGAGKTTLVSSYLGRESEAPSIWYQVDAGDRDIARIAERTVEGSGVLGRVGEDGDLVESRVVEGLSDGEHLAVHHPGRGGDVGAVGGLRNLTRWISLRRTAFLEPDGQLDTPRGILLTGVQGSGKSLAAKAVAGMWQLPLLRLDFGTLYNKFFGETERNLREALHAAEAMAPCVLWIDEIEKAIASGDYDSGTSRRILGNLLTWMAERKPAVFIVATANAIEQLPPELIRKGRLDEIFFVDLPDAPTRAEILAIHLRSRGLKPVDFDLLELANLSEGFSGAELEQAIVAGLYLAREQQASLDTGHLRSEIEQTRPLSQVMAEKIGRLRAWAQDRTVAAD